MNAHVLERPPTRCVCGETHEHVLVGHRQHVSFSQEGEESSTGRHSSQPSNFHASRRSSAVCQDPVFFVSLQMLGASPKSSLSRDFCHRIGERIVYSAMRSVCGSVRGTCWLRLHTLTKRNVGCTYTVGSPAPTGPEERILPHEVRRRRVLRARSSL